MWSVITVFKDKKIGNVLVTTEKTKECFCIFTKKDFLLNILQSYRPQGGDLRYLNIQIEDIHTDLIVDASKVLRAQSSVLLIECFRLIKEQEVG